MQDIRTGDSKISLQYQLQFVINALADSKHNKNIPKNKLRNCTSLVMLQRAAVLWINPFLVEYDKLLSYYLLVHQDPNLPVFLSI